MQTITHNLDLINIKYPEHILNQNIHLFNNDDWNNISVYQSLSEPFIEKYKNKLNWFNIPIWQSLSESFIVKYQHKLDWDFISQYQSLSPHFIQKYKHNIRWKLLFFNKFIPINSKLLFASKFNWNYICNLQ